MLKESTNDNDDTYQKLKNRNNILKQKIQSITGNTCCISIDDTTINGIKKSNVELKKILRQLVTDNIYNNDNIELYNNMVMMTKQKMDYEYLVFSGGSVKAESYCGVLDVLYDKKILYENNKLKMKGFGGTSAGSIFAALLAIGYLPQEIKNITRKIDFSKLIYNSNYIIDAYRFLRYYGVSNGDKLKKLLEKIIEDKTKNKKYTIQQLYDEKNVKLVITTTNIDLCKTEYFYPNCPDSIYSNIPIIDAIMMSISIPFIFEPIKFNNYNYVDGGVIDRYPIHIFDGKSPDDEMAMLHIIKPNSKVLGVKISESDDDGINDTKNLFNYTINFVDIFLKGIDTRVMTPWNFSRTIIIDVPIISITKFSLTDSERDELVKAGKHATKSFFNI